MLLYGQHVQLHARCIESVRRSILADRLGFVSEVRIGLNRVHPAAAKIAAALSDEIGLRVITYRPNWPDGSPAYKYPLMRKMLYDVEHPLDELAAWFDDDSYLERTQAWWHHVRDRLETHDVVGYLRKKLLNGWQDRWLLRQPWFNERHGVPMVVNFAQGGLWAWRTAAVARHNWPWPELRHCGGDSWLGELCRHQGLRLGSLPPGGVPNASLAGGGDKSRRRGYTEPELGAVNEPPTYHQHEFTCEKTVYEDGTYQRSVLTADRYGPTTQTP